MICENWDPFKKNKREALIKKLVLKRLGRKSDPFRPNSSFFDTKSGDSS